LSELSTAEKMRRIGTMGETAQAICKTALTLEQNNVEDAKLYAARADWFKEELLKQIAKIEEETGKSVVASVASSAEKTSSTETEGAAETTTMPSDPAASKTDDTVKEADLKSVAKLRPEHYRIRSKEDFYRALKLTNPDYDLRGYFNTDEKDNFTAVDLAGAKVSDISVLRTLDLEYLNLNGTEVESIEATRRMPLKTLVISGTKVADLSPLQNSRTLQKLNLIGTPVKTLRVLSNVKLEVIGIDPAKFEDPNEVKNLRRIKSLKMVVTPHGEFDMPRFYVKLEAGDFQKPPPADVDIGFPNVFGTLGRLRK
jgi:hypothetical protein